MELLINFSISKNLSNCYQVSIYAKIVIKLLMGLLNLGKEKMKSPNQLKNPFKYLYSKYK